jgi:hypothetical protein
MRAAVTLLVAVLCLGAVSAGEAPRFASEPKIAAESVDAARLGGFFDEFYYGLIVGLQENPADPSACMRVFPRMSRAWANFTTEFTQDTWTAILQFRVWANELNSAVEKC